MLWGFEGPALDAAEFVEEYRIQHTTLVDDDLSLYADYFITQENRDAFAKYPRHFIIDHEGRFAYVATQYEPDALLAAIDGALAAAAAD